MIEPEVLADRLQELAVLLRSQGGVTWERVDAWTKACMPRLFEADDDDQEAAERAGRSERSEEDRREDAAAGRYKDELGRLTKRLEADVARLGQIVGVCNPVGPKRLSRGDRQAAQVAAEGDCVLCWRAGCSKEIEVDREGHRLYRDRCKWHADWRRNHGDDPPNWLVVKHHDRGRVSTADVERALGKGA